MKHSNSKTCATCKATFVPESPLFILCINCRGVMSTMTIESLPTNEESEEESEGDPFICKCGGCSEAEKTEQQEKPEIIWRAAAGFEDDLDNVYFKDKEDGKRYILDRMKELLDNERCWDEDGDLCFEFIFGLEHVTLH